MTASRAFSMGSWLCALFVSALALTLWPRPVSAQEANMEQGSSGSPPQEATSETPSRPFRGLFGLADSNRSGLDASGSIFGMYNDNRSETPLPVSIDSPYQRSGWLSGAQGRVAYNRSGERSSAGAWASAGTNYYDSSQSFVPYYGGGFGFSSPLGRRNSFTASQTVFYSPFYLNGFNGSNGFFAALPSVVAPPVPGPDDGQDFAVADDRVVRLGTTVGFSRQLSRKASITARYMFQASHYVGIDRRYLQQGGLVTFRRRFTEHASLRAGYGYRTFRVEDPLLPDAALRDHEFHDLDLGIDYSRGFSLSMTRRTQLTFSTNSSVVVGREVPVDGGEPRHRRHVFVGGTASLAHEMGRTWQALLIYTRSAGFSDLFFQPVTSDAISASIGGLLDRHDEVGAVASTSTGNVGFGAGRRGFDFYQARAYWRRAITANIAAYANYLLYKHSFAQATTLPLGIAPRLDRQGVQVGLTVWFPISGRVR